MTQLKKEVNSDSVQRDTGFAIQYANETIESALRYLADPDRKQRMTEARCKRCFYMMRSRIGGACMTQRPCGICNKNVMYGSTATDILCEPCGVKHAICRQCGGDLLMRPRRVYE